MCVYDDVDMFSGYATSAPNLQPKNPWTARQWREKVLKRGNLYNNNKKGSRSGKHIHSEQVLLLSYCIT